MNHFAAKFFQLATLLILAGLVIAFWPVLLWLAIVFLAFLGALVIGIPLWLRYRMKRNFADAFYRRRGSATPAETPPSASGDVIDTTAEELDEQP